MFDTVYDFKSFYNTRYGRMVQRIIRAEIERFWPDTGGMTVLGCGYAAPYVRLFQAQAQSLTLAMPASMGAHIWPRDGKNTVCLSEESELPFETNSIDRILVVHSLEHTELVRPALEELWRILKSDGHLLVIAPNRLGVWARAEWTPFGHGRPFSAQQLGRQLREALFVQEHCREALFTPPLRSRLIMRAVPMFERAGRYLYPALGGIHIIEASKQLYAPTGTKAPAGIKIRGRALFQPRPASPAR
jgi:SAM-dependent methyltransferase